MEPLSQSFLKKVSSVASSLVNILENNHTTIINIMGVIIAFVAEYVVEENGIFSCPCKRVLSLQYGLSFIIGGFLIFWMIGLLVYAHTWRGCHGCCRPWNKKMCCVRLNHFFSTCAKTMVFPLAWVFSILLDGDYIACMLSKSCDEKSEDYDKFKKKSQEWAFWSLGIVLSLVVLVRCISRCFYKKCYVHYTFIEEYRKVEDEILFKTIPDTVKGRAPEVVNTFLQMRGLAEDEWTKATNESVDVGTYFSPLHKFINERRRRRWTN